MTIKFIFALFNLKIYISIYKRDLWIEDYSNTYLYVEKFLIKNLTNYISYHEKYVVKVLHKLLKSIRDDLNISKILASLSLSLSLSWLVWS